jgi:P27 family predicted phage terminase small subunit
MAGVKGQRSGGRNRKPRALHVVEGTFRKSDHAGADVEAPAGCPPVPDGLTGAALDEWRNLTALLRRQGTLSTVDAPMLESHCRLAALVRRLESEVESLPLLTFTSDAGEPRVHPLVSQLRQARQALRASLQEFGLTPRSRTTVTRPVTPAAANPLRKYTRRAHAARG